MDTDNRNFFSNIYRDNLWCSTHSRSGPGSEGLFADQKTACISSLLQELDIRTILDIGCGDLHWMQQLANSLDQYLGVDIVPELIAHNNARYASSQVRFMDTDLTQMRNHAEPTNISWDLVLCLDIFGHLSSDEVDGLIRFLTDSVQTSYLLVTNRRDQHSTDYLTRTKSRQEGIDIEVHPRFIRSGYQRLSSTPALYPNDFFDLYLKST
jgi:2-polyprenyl-3-methyl-5-hydroxy-6-metoxy-1,4-benzoquinol methylase